MNRVICVKGHFYDGDKYDACPHCAAGVEAIAQSVFAVRTGAVTEEKREEKGTGRKSEKKAQRDKKGFFSRKSRQTVDVQVNTANAGETLLLQDSGNSHLITSQPIVSQPAVSQSAVLPSAGNSSLVSAFAAVQKSEERDERKTIGFFSTGANLNPPVGYLVCIAGEDFGMGFPLKSGSNSLGRSVSMDIVVMDEKVSREKQAFVIYEPLKREFYIRPGEESALCYLNGDVVLEIRKLKQHDVIMLGSTRLMLVPVCGEDFSWDDIDMSMRAGK